MVMCSLGWCDFVIWWQLKRRWVHVEFLPRLWYDLLRRILRASSFWWPEINSQHFFVRRCSQQHEVLLSPISHHARCSSRMRQQCMQRLRTVHAFTASSPVIGAVTSLILPTNTNINHQQPPRTCTQLSRVKHTIAHIQWITWCTQNTRRRCSTSMGFVHEASCWERWRVVGNVDFVWLHGWCGGFYRGCVSV